MTEVDSLPIKNQMTEDFQTHKTLETFVMTDPMRDPKSSLNTVPMTIHLMMMMMGSTWQETEERGNVVTVGDEPGVGGFDSKPDTGETV